MVQRGILNNINLIGASAGFNDRSLLLIITGAGIPGIVVIMASWMLAVGRSGSAAFRNPIITGFYAMDEYESQVISVFGFWGYASMPNFKYLAVGADIFWTDRYVYNPKTDPDCWSTALAASGVAVPDNADFCYECRKSSLVGAGILGALIGASAISMLHVLLVCSPYGKWYEEHLPFCLSPKDLHLALTGTILVVGFSGLGTFNPCKEAISEFYNLAFASLGGWKVRWGSGFAMMIVTAVIFCLGAVGQLLIAWPTQCGVPAPALPGAAATDSASKAKEKKIGGAGASFETVPIAVTHAGDNKSTINNRL
jgi:hypothetical protein